MSNRIHNFSAGPSALPIEVLEQAKADLTNYKGAGLSVMEMSHRSKDFQAIFDEAKATVVELLGVPDTHDVLFLQGGASLQFAMLAMNLGKGGAYINTGTWSTKALKEARTVGEAYEAWSDADHNFTGVPQPGEDLRIPAEATYVHYTSNNTIFGTQFAQMPETDKPLVCDMSSDIFSRPIDVGAHALIYAGAQKNAGPSGVTLVIGERDRLHNFTGDGTVPLYLRYATHAAKDSLFNTPNTWGLYLLGLVAQHVKGLGGVTAMAEQAEAKGKLLYDLIDGADVFEGHARADSRSLMNVTFRAGGAEREAAIVAAAAEAGISGIKGHRSVGGLRASIYNAVPMAAVEALVGLLKGFA